MFSGEQESRILSIDKDLPIAALRPCLHGKCPTLVEHGRCAKHSAQREQARDNYEVRRWYRTKRWEDLRAQVLREEPLCMCPEHRGRDARAISTVVDHKLKHNGSEYYFYLRDNLQGMAKRCHDRKTQRGE